MAVIEVQAGPHQGDYSDPESRLGSREGCRVRQVVPSDYEVQLDWKIVRRYLNCHNAWLAKAVRWFALRLESAAATRERRSTPAARQNLDLP